MRYLTLSLLLLILTATLNAQKKTPAKKQNANTEMAELMKEMEAAMSEMSPEDRKMLDSMGVKLPGMNNMQQMAAFAMANADKADVTLAIPKRDANRISSIPRSVMTRQAMPAYIQATHEKLAARIPKAVQDLALKQYKQLSVQSPGKNSRSSAAIGYLSMGNVQAGLYLMSLSCLENPGNDNDLNNLAAMLNMSGGENLALPILQFLNRQYPGNSTILNNIAHAWFGLGDIATATKYIDSTIRLCAWHPQANQIRAAIQESKGDHAAAVNSLKNAISRIYSREKEEALREKGYKLKSDDINFGPRNAPDQLGLSRFIWPALPKSVDASERLEPEWKIFRKMWDDRMAALKAENEMLVAAYQEALQKRMQNEMAAGGAGAGLAGLASYIVPKAEAKLRPYIDVLMEMEAKDPWGLAILALKDTLLVYDQETADEIRQLTKTLSPGGEGTGVNEAYCEAIDGAYTRLLSRANTLVENFSIRYRDRAKKRITEMVNYQLYTEFPEKFALSVNLAKIEWMSYIMINELVYFRGRTYCGKPAVKPDVRHPKLANFDDVNCPYRSEMDFFVSSIEVACGRTIAKINLPNFKAEWHSLSADNERNRNLFDEFQRCTIEASVGYSKELGKGPLQLQATAQVTGFVEIDRTGVSDAGFKAEVGVGVQTNVVDPKIQTGIGDVNVGPTDRSMSFGGAEATISINSGFTAGGTGILKGIKP